MYPVGMPRSMSMAATGLEAHRSVPVCLSMATILSLLWRYSASPSTASVPGRIFDDNCHSALPLPVSMANSFRSQPFQSLLIGLPGARVGYRLIDSSSSDVRGEPVTRK